MKKVKIIIGIIALSTLTLTQFGCNRSDPPTTTPDGDAWRKGDQVRFADREWTVEVREKEPWGFGPNFYTGDTNDITIDDSGYLHMKIVRKNGNWFCSEIYSNETTGYGTYVFTVEGNLDALDLNVALKMFSWDAGTFQSDANSEVSLDISKWSLSHDTAKTLQYIVHPVNNYWDDIYKDRYFRPQYTFGKMNGVSTHAFTWTPDKITWTSYAGDKIDEEELLGSFSFDSSNDPIEAIKNGSTSDGVVIPKPGADTRTRINFSIIPWINQIPINNKELEVVIRDFYYIEL